MGISPRFPAKGLLGDNCGELADDLEKILAALQRQDDVIHDRRPSQLT